MVSRPRVLVLLAVAMTAAIVAVVVVVTRDDRPSLEQRVARAWHGPSATRVDAFTSDGLVGESPRTRLLDLLLDEEHGPLPFDEDRSKDDVQQLLGRPDEVSDGGGTWTYLLSERKDPNPYGGGTCRRLLDIFYDDGLVTGIRGGTEQCRVSA